MGRKKICGNVEPSHAALPAAYHMHMDVVDHLAATSADIDCQPVALLSNSPLRGEVFGSRKEFSHERDMLVFHIVERRDVLLRYEEHVDRRSRIDIFEDHDLVIFMDDIGRRGLGNDLAKQTWHGLVSSPRVAGVGNGTGTAACPDRLFLAF